MASIKLLSGRKKELKRFCSELATFSHFAGLGALVRITEGEDFAGGWSGQSHNYNNRLFFFLKWELSALASASK
jgi:hypothetical protein